MEPAKAVKMVLPFLVFRLLKDREREVRKDMDSETSDVTVKLHINRLRKRFESYPEFEIMAIRGIGYKAVIHHG